MAEIEIGCFADPPNHETLVFEPVSLDAAGVVDDIMRFEQPRARRGRWMTLDQASAELGVDVDELDEHERVLGMATFDEVAARGIQPGAPVHEQPRTEAEPQRWAVDQERAAIDERIQTYAADHDVSYADAFAAIAIAQEDF